MNRPEFPNPFHTEGLWFKGNLHTHTTNSDGLLSPSQIAFLYRVNGYDFISITDHGKLTDVTEIPTATEDFLVLPGEEIDIGGLHLTAFNIDAEIQSRSSPGDVINDVQSQGGEVIVAHPYWSGLLPRDLLGLDGYLGIEVYNATCDVSVAKGYSRVHWDALLQAGRCTYGFAVDDAHGGLSVPGLTDACRGWVMVRAERLSPESLMESLRRGLFYSSTGPEIRGLEVDGNVIRVESSQASSISFIARNGLGRRITARGNPISRASYTIRGNEGYIRIEVDDGRGGTAWTNPILL